jgi:hypothetical protein
LFTSQQKYHPPKVGGYFMDFWWAGLLIKFTKLSGHVPGGVPNIPYEFGIKPT